MESRALPGWHWAVGSQTGGGTHERPAEIIRSLKTKYVRLVLYVEVHCLYNAERSHICLQRQKTAGDMASVSREGHREDKAAYTQKPTNLNTRSNF